MTKAEAKEPLPFALPWTATLGPLVERGSGVLTPNVFKQRHCIDKFVVDMGGWTATVVPRDGHIIFDTRIMAVLPPEKNPILVWFRRMERQIGTHDTTNDPSTCLWYGIGLETPDQRIGFRLFRDGRVTEGLS